MRRRFPSCRGSASNASRDAYGVNPAQATQLVDNAPLAEYFDRVVLASTQSAAGDELRARRAFAARQRIRVARWRSRRSRPSIVAELIATRRRQNDQLEDRQGLCSRACGQGAGSPKAIVERKASRRPATRARSRNSSTRCSPPTRRSSPTIKAGKTNVAGFLVGQIMKAVGRQSRPRARRELLRKQLEVYPSGTNAASAVDARRRAARCEALDFAGVRERVVAATHTQRGRRSRKSGARGRLRRRPAGTSSAPAARAICSRARICTASAAIDTAKLTPAAALGRTLGAERFARGRRRAGRRGSCAPCRDPRERRSSARSRRGYAAAELQRAIADGIDERGAVLDRASPALGRIRRNLSQRKRKRAIASARSCVRPSSPRPIQDSVVTMREGRFVVPVKAEFSGEFPGHRPRYERRADRRSSSSRSPRSTPTIACARCASRKNAKSQRILEEFSGRVGADAGAIETQRRHPRRHRSARSPKPKSARAMDAVAPANCATSRSSSIRAGRHPLLGGRAVPQSLVLDEATRVLVISGPNMGGKTVALKMVGLFVAMTYCGLQLPAALGTTIGRFDRALRRHRRRAVDCGQHVDVLRAFASGCGRCSRARAGARS